MMDTTREHEPVSAEYVATERTSERELLVSRTVNAPARLVFEAWTRPELFRQWWTPKSFPITLLSCDMDVRVGGGPAMLRDFLAADLIDFMHVVQVPILLGRGVRLWDGLEGLEGRFNIEVVSSPRGVAHLTFTRR